MKIQADLHTHTIASTHAYSTIIENSVSAKEMGLKAVAMTDHAPKMSDAPHVWHFHNMGAIPEKLNGVYIVKGIEANILDFNGNIDVDENLYKFLSWVVASMHGPVVTPGSVEENTKAYINACKNPYIDVFGHTSTNEYLWSYEEGLKAVKEYGKIIELNESSIKTRKGALENMVEILKLCKLNQIPICVNTDSHFCYKIGKTPLSIKILEELDFPKDLIFNLEWERVKEYIQNKHPNTFSE